MPRPSRAYPILIGIIATIMVGWLLHLAAGILQPLVIALLLCVVLQPVVRILAHAHIPPALTVIALVSLLFFGLFQLGVLIDQNVRAFVGTAQPGTSDSRAASALPAAEQAPPPAALLPEQGTAEVEKTTDWLTVVNSIETRLTESDLPETLSDYIVTSLRELDVGGLLAGILGGGIDFARGLFLVVLYMLFIFAEQAVFRRKILHIAGERREEAKGMLDSIGGGIQRYLIVKTVASFCTGTLCYMVLVHQEVPYAPLFGFLTFLLNYIPTFGSIIAGLLASVVAFASGDISSAVIIVVWYLSVNLTIGSYLEPRVLGQQLNLSPLVVIVSVVVWATLWGAIGGFLAVPLTSAIQIVLAGTPSTLPLAVMLSSGPPADPSKRGRRRKQAPG